MNKKALLYGLLYCVLVIAFKLYIVLSGNMFSKFGFNYSIITAVLLILPFFFIAVYHVREKDYGGFIGSKEASRIAFTVLAVGIVGTIIYNYMEFNWKIDEYINYYNGQAYLENLKAQQARYPNKIKVEDFPVIIKDQIASLSAFKATTGKLIPLLFLGLIGALGVSVLLKRVPKQ